MIKKKKSPYLVNKDIKDTKVRIYIVMAILILSMGGCAVLNKFVGLPPDNVIEQTVEAVIEAETGISVDLTP